MNGKGGEERSGNEACTFVQQIDNASRDAAAGGGGVVRTVFFSASSSVWRGDTQRRSGGRLKKATRRARKKGGACVCFLHWLLRSAIGWEEPGRGKEEGGGGKNDISQPHPHVRTPLQGGEGEKVPIKGGKGSV